MESEIWFTGYVARAEGKSEKNNPYHKVDPRYSWWLAGYDDAREDYINRGEYPLLQGVGDESQV